MEVAVFESMLTNRLYLVASVGYADQKLVGVQNPYKKDVVAPLNY